jgi:hypothetical protein
MRELSKRGNLILGIVIGLALAGIVWISSSLWYVEGNGYCRGTMVECYGE